MPRIDSAARLRRHPFCDFQLTIFISLFYKALHAHIYTLVLAAYTPARARESQLVRGVSLYVGVLIVLLSSKRVSEDALSVGAMMYLPWTVACLRVGGKKENQFCPPTPCSGKRSTREYVPPSSRLPPLSPGRPMKNTLICNCFACRSFTIKATIYLLCTRPDDGCRLISLGCRKLFSLERIILENIHRSSHFLFPSLSIIVLSYNCRFSLSNLESIFPRPAWYVELWKLGAQKELTSS